MNVSERDHDITWSDQFLQRGSLHFCGDVAGVALEPRPGRKATTRVSCCNPSQLQWDGKSSDLICWTTFTLGYVHGYNWERHSQPGDRYPGSHWEMDAWPSRDWVDRPGRIIPVQSRVITPQDWQWYLSICLWDKPGTGRHGTGDYTDSIFIYFLFKSLEVKQHGRHWNSGSIRRLPGVWFVEPYGHARSLSSEFFSCDFIRFFSNSWVDHDFFLIFCQFLAILLLHGSACAS